MTLRSALAQTAKNLKGLVVPAICAASLLWFTTKAIEQAYPRVYPTDTELADLDYAKKIRPRIQGVVTSKYFTKTHPRDMYEFLEHGLYKDVCVVSIESVQDSTTYMLFSTGKYAPAFWSEDCKYALGDTILFPAKQFCPNPDDCDYLYGDDVVSVVKYSK